MCTRPDSRTPPGRPRRSCPSPCARASICTSPAPSSRKDRHACLGEGTIGLEALGRIVRHPALKDLPFCLETPNDLPGYAREIALMREMAEA